MIGTPARQIVSAGLLTGLVVGGVVLAMRIAPALRFAYPLALLPLLATGPLAARGHRSPWRRAIVGGLGGALGGALVAGELALAVNWLGESRWALLGPATASPMPTLPRFDLFPALTWPQEDILILEPPLAALLAVVYGLVVAAPRTGLQARLLRAVSAHSASVRQKLTLAFASVVCLAVAIAWTGFSALEDSHLRGHRLQLQVDWAGHLDSLTASLNATERTMTEAATAEARQTVLTQLARDHASVVEHLRGAPRHPEIWLAPQVLTSTAERYRAEVDALDTAVTEYQEAAEGVAPGDRGGEVAMIGVANAANAANAADAAILALQMRVRNDLRVDLDSSDFDHHADLMRIMALVVLSATLAVVISRAISGMVTDRLAEAGKHLSRLARGDFSGRLLATSGDELGRLARELNRVTAELDRLYRAERAARETAQELAAREHQLAAAKEFWAHTLVHDLRSPLSSAIGFSELLSHGRLGELAPRQADAVAEIERASSQVTVLIQDILDVFRMEQSTLSLDPERCTAAELVAAACESVRRPGRQAPVQAIEAGLWVQGDRRLLERTLTNLLENAYKHAGEQASLFVSAASGLNGTVTLAVEDDGPGIPPEARTRIFERFSQGSRAKQGAGLGLTFSNLVVQSHGGRLWAETSSRMGGARICLAVPGIARTPEPEGPGRNAVLDAVPPMASFDVEPAAPVGTSGER
ncbi:MAG: HAMP domain-containing histidine kinase [Chloroflexi bacterium]|nr:HAMP domain-containing histidine kinase [Chloroflexota bacterium]